MPEKFPRDEFKNIVIFLNAAVDACKDFDKDYTFICPICGGEAHASKTSYNGHHAGGCNSCNMNFIE